MTPSRIVFPLVLLAAVATGCGASMGADVSGAGQSGAGSSQPDYGATKQMVVDILHSPEGKSAVAEMLQDPSFKQKVVVSETDVSKAVEKTIQSSKGQSFLSQQAKNPEFASALSKAVQPDMMQLQKQLMKDPEYQKDMLVLLESPDFTKNLQTLMQSSQYRGLVMKIMTDALQTPSFRMQFQDALKSAVAESMQSAGGQAKGGKGGGQAGGGGGSEGGGGDGGGDGGGGGGS